MLRLKKSKQILPKLSPLFILKLHEQKNARRLENLNIDFCLSVHISVNNF